jgi:hypothetical protein
MLAAKMAWRFGRNALVRKLLRDYHGGRANEAPSPTLKRLGTTGRSGLPKHINQAISKNDETRISSHESPIDRLC